MKTFIIALLTLTSTFACAQNTATWIGGTAGNETSWNEPRNWDNYQIPDEDSHIIIKPLNTGHFAQPIINEHVEVASIEIYAGASLTIEANGKVLIDGSVSYTEGIVNYGGSLINEGQISLQHIGNLSTEKLQITMKGDGLVMVDGSPINDKLLAID